MKTNNSRIKKYVEEGKIKVECPYCQHRAYLHEFLRTENSKIEILCPKCIKELREIFFFAGKIKLKVRFL